MIGELPKWYSCTVVTENTYSDKLTMTLIFEKCVTRPIDLRDANHTPLGIKLHPADESFCRINAATICQPAQEIGLR